MAKKTNKKTLERLIKREQESILNLPYSESNRPVFERARKKIKSYYERFKYAD